MQLIIVTGLSGGGKSIAIRQLEDSGFYCIDNLPAEFLLPIAENLEKNGTRAAAVAIDARSHATFENAFTALEARSQRGIDVRILFLTASNEELLRRFSETRRRHPLSTLAEHQGRELTLNEAIAREREIMAPVTETAHVLDTTRLLPSQLVVGCSSLSNSLLPNSRSPLNRSVISVAFLTLLTLSLTCGACPTPITPPSFARLRGLMPLLLLTLLKSP